MIRILDIPGGCEGEALPDGTYLSLVRGSRLVTSQGDVALPAEEVAAGGLGPLYVRLSADGLKMAGQSHGLARVTWEHTAGVWTRINQTACGVNPVIYDAGGVLHISDCSVGTQGWRYVEAITGRMVTGDETLADPSRVIGEYTTYGEITVGQSGYDCVALANGKRYVLAAGPQPGGALIIRFNRWGSQCAVATWLQSACLTRFLWFDVADLPQFPEQQAPAEPPIPQPVGPLVPQRSADGHVIDLYPFIMGTPDTWPRNGPTHAMDQTPLHHGGVFEYMKFGSLAPAGAHYEQWAVDDHWFHLLEDSSGTDSSNTWTDTRHFPRRMAISESRAWLSGEHKFLAMAHGTCKVFETRELSRAVWILALWDRYWCGPDLGDRAVVCLVFDATADAYSADRMIELNYFAFGAGWFRWEAHRSDLVYASGSPVFNEHTLSGRSDFYLRGGTRVRPVLSGCIPQRVPTAAPWVEDIMIEPAVTVDIFTMGPNNHLPDGELISFHDRVNPSGAQVRVWVERGSAYMSLTYTTPTGPVTGRTGKTRPVR